jgi:hypothetical protein
MAEPAYEDPATRPEPVVAAPAETYERPRFAWVGLAGRIILTAIGAGALIVSAFVDWMQNLTGVNLDISAFWQTPFRRETKMFVATVGFAVIVLGLLAVVGLAARSGWLTRLAGALGIVAFVLFIIEVYRADLTVSEMQAGPWIALVGGVLALIAGFMGTRTTVMPTTTTTTTHTPTVVEP